MQEGPGLKLLEAVALCLDIQKEGRKEGRKGEREGGREKGREGGRETQNLYYSGSCSFLKAISVTSLTLHYRQRTIHTLIGSLTNVGSAL